MLFQQVVETQFFLYFEVEWKNVPFLFLVTQYLNQIRPVQIPGSGFLECSLQSETI